MFNKFLLLCSFVLILCLPFELTAGNNEPVDTVEDSSLSSSSTTAVLPTVEDLEQSIKSWLGKMRGERWKKAFKTATYIVEESLHYDFDPYLTLSLMIHESSLRSKVESTSSLKEWGYAQAHGQALARCKKQLKVRSIDYASERGQVACVLITLNEGMNACGVLVEDTNKCLKKRKHKNQQRVGCNGAISRYVSGRCERANVSLGVSSAVVRRVKMTTSLKSL